MCIFWDKKSQLDIPEPLSELLSFLDVLFVKESFRLSGIFEDFNELFGKTTLNIILLWFLCFYYERIPPLDSTRFLFSFSCFFVPARISRQKNWDHFVCVQKSYVANYNHDLSFNDFFLISYQIFHCLYTWYFSIFVLKLTNEHIQLNIFLFPFKSSSDATLCFPQFLTILQSQ